MAVEPLTAGILGPLYLTVGLVFAALFLALATPPGAKPWPPGATLQGIAMRARQDRLFFALGAFALVGHLVQVNLIGPHARAWWLEATGIDFAAVLHALEGDIVPAMSAIHWWPLLFVMYWFYLVLHNAFLFIVPLFLLHVGERRILRRLLASYAVLWLIAQVGFFLVPADNPTIHLGLESTLDKVIPGTDAVFYTGTTISNTVPSLHVGLATVILLHGLHSTQRRLRLSVIVYAPAVAFSVVYLQVHWALDAVAGVIAALIAYRAGISIERRLRPRAAIEGPAAAQAPPVSGR